MAILFREFYQWGLFTTLQLTSEEANSLPAEDLATLREDLGAGEPMLEQLRELAREPGRQLVLDFKHQTVTIEEP